MGSYWDANGNLIDGRFEVNITKVQRVPAFSTSTPLAANAVYTSPTIDAINYKTLRGRSLSDQAGGYVVQHSDDGISWQGTASNTVTANTLGVPTAALSGRYIRIVYTNGATLQTSFILSMYLEPL